MDMYFKLMWSLHRVSCFLLTIFRFWGTFSAKKSRKEETAWFIDSPVKDVREFEAEREKLIRSHEERKVELRRKHLAEEAELEKELDAALTKLKELYSPSSFFEASTSSS